MRTLFSDQFHCKNILHKLWLQRESKELCDVVLIAGPEGIRIPAHRSVLSAASDYFNAMFTASMRESTSKEVKLYTIDGDVLKSLIEYCYAGRVVIKEDVVELLKAADMLLLSSVVAVCSDFLAEQLHPNNCLGIALLAERYRRQSLLQKANDYSLDHYMSVCKEAEFLRLNEKQLGRLLACDNLCASAEEYIFNSVMAWIHHDQIKREKHKYELFKSVRMPLLERSFLTDHVKVVCTSTECLQLYVEALAWHLLPDRKILNATKSRKPKKLHHFLMGITLSESNNKMCLHYFCPRLLKWLNCFNGLEYREFFGVAVMEDKLYVVGGYDARKNVLNTAICLNLKSMTFSQINSMTEHRAQCSLAVLNGFLYAVGGVNAGRVLNSVEKWDPNTNTWNEVASMPSGYAAFDSAMFKKKSYLTVSYSTANSVSSTESVISMNRSGRFHGVAVANDRLYAVGRFHTVEEYDPEINKWTTSCFSIFYKAIVFYNECVENTNALMSVNELDNIYAILTCSNNILSTFIGLSQN